jgi:hypothetical protein
MPVRNLALLLGLFCLCLGIVGLAWGTESQLYLYFPSRFVHRPPTHPGVILALLVATLPIAYWLRQSGVYVFAVLTAGMLAGSVVGRAAFQWTPSLAQHFLAVAMIATSIYAWKQKYYFED